MKTLLTSKTIVALAVAIAASATNIVNAYEQPIPPPAQAADLPPNIIPGSDLAQVFKLVQANVELSVIQTFIANSTSRFDLDASRIITLNDAGVPSSLLDAMLAHDRQLAAAAAPTPPPAPASTPVVVETVATTPPPAVTVNYFYDTLSPYGTWVEVAGYGRCWRPTTVVYDVNWRPYCDRGHLVWTDCGWYWDSDYAWGTTFHYGRWFRDARFGWCWWPDTTWAPSWVLWRSGPEVCGWAPLPPRCFYRQEHGFLYNGNNITVGFDFGLGESYFSFVAYNYFFDRHLRDRCEDSRRVSQYYRNTTIVNNYNFNGSRKTIVNSGIPVDRFASAVHHPVQAVAVNTLPNATRQGWRGEGRTDRSPAILDRNGQRGYGNALKSSSAQIGSPVTTSSAVGSAKVYSPDSDSNRNQHSSRLDQQRTRGQNLTTPALTTTAPQRSTLSVDQPQIIHPQTPAQNGQVLDATTRSARLEQQRNLATAIINTTPPQRSELQVQQPQIVRPTVPNTVLQPSSGYMQQRAQQQLENHVYESRSNPERAASYQAPAPVQRASEAPSRSNSDNRSSDRDKK